MPNVSARPQTKATSGQSRRDPAFRPTTGGFDGVQLKNKNPSKEYVIVDPSIKEIYHDYLNNGWTPVESKQGGEGFVSGLTSKPGEVVEFRGCVLMSIDKELKQQRDAEGLAYAEDRMAAIRRKSMTSKIRQEYRGGVGEGAEIETEIEIPSRGVSNG